MLTEDRNIDASAFANGEYRDLDVNPGRGVDQPFKTLAIRIYTPDSGSASPSAQPNKIIVFSHGGGGGLQGADFLAEQWTAQGYVVISPEHPDSDTAYQAAVQTHAGDLFGPEYTALGGAPAFDRFRADDVKIAIDWAEQFDANHRGGVLTVGGIEFKLDGDTVVLASHSLGGKTTQILAGATPTYKEGEVVVGPTDFSDWKDDRVDGVMNLSGVGPDDGGADFKFERDAWDGIPASMPWMVVSGSLDTAARTTDPGDRLEPVFSHVENTPDTIRKHAVWIDGATHEGLRRPSDDGAFDDVQAITQDFLETYFPTALSAGTGALASHQILAPQLGTLGNDTIVMGTTDELRFARAGNDWVTGSSASDQIFGMAGNDTVQGGAGADTINGGIGDDRLNGHGGDDDILGGKGNDWITGGLGNDTLWGNDGDDVLTGGDGADTVNYSNAQQAGVTVELDDPSTPQDTADGSASGGDQGIDQLSSIENVIGSRYADTIIGSGGDNSLFGAGDADRLTGGAGADTLDGGPGRDVFDFDAIGDSVGISRDVLAAFEGLGASAEDRIDVSTIDANTATDGNQSFSSEFRFDEQPFTAAGQIRIVDLGADAVIEFNTDDDVMTVEMEILITNVDHWSFVASDFVL
jgi:Ca2+-binding RTX toxin-like protein